MDGFKSVRMSVREEEEMAKKCSVCGEPQEETGICQDCWDEDQQKDYCANLMEGMQMRWDID